MGLARLGKRWHKLLRDPRQISTEKNSVGFKHGEPIKVVKKEVKVFANIQSSFSPFYARQLKEGDREKSAIWFSSDHWVYEARVGNNPADPDIILYNGSEWEVVTSMPYGNFGTHVEGIAVKVNPTENMKKVVNREDSLVGVIGE